MADASPGAAPGLRRPLLLGAAAAGSIAVLVTLREPLNSTIRWLLGWDAWVTRTRPKRTGRKLKVAILGGGLAGSAVALWLRDALGNEEELDLVVICDGPIGGRCQSVEFDGQTFDAGASAIPETSMYFQALMRRFSLKKLPHRKLHQPFAVFGSSHFLYSGFSASSLFGNHMLARLLTDASLAWRFGWRPWRKLLRSGPRFQELHRTLREGASFAHPRELLSALGHSCLRLSERSLEQWVLKEARSPPAFLAGAVEPALRACYAGQSSSEVHAFAGLLALQGRLGSTFAVDGGASSLPQRMLQAAKPRLLRGTARNVRRPANAAPNDPPFEVAYDATCGRGEAMKGPGDPSVGRGKTGRGAEGLIVEAFHAVIVAHPLVQSSVRFEGCCTADAPEEGWTGPDLVAASPPVPFSRCVAHFVRGSPDLRSLCSVEGADAGGLQGSQTSRGSLAAFRSRSRPFEEEQPGQLPNCIPAQLWTTPESNLPFYSMSLQFPVSLPSLQEARSIVASAAAGEPQVYKILAPLPLSEKKIDRWFTRAPGTEVRIVDWYACPQYSAPQSFRPFVLDKAGVFYVNAIEEVASSVEVSLIGARNVVNLVMDWLAQRRGRPNGL